MTLASTLIALNTQKNNRVQAAKFAISQHLNGLLNMAQWSPLSSDPNDLSRAYPESEQVRLIAATDQEYVELEREKAKGSYNKLTDSSEFDILKFYSDVKKYLFAQYALSNETVIMHTRGLDTDSEEKAEVVGSMTADQFIESKVAEPDVSPDVQIVHPNGNIIIGSTFPNGIIRIYAPDNNTLIRSFSQNGFGVDVMTILPNGNLVVGAKTPDSTIRIYNPEDGTLKQSIPDKYGVILMATALNGNIVVLTSIERLPPVFHTGDYFVREYLPEEGRLAKRTKNTSKAISSPLGLLAINNLIEIGIGLKIIKNKVAICIADFQSPSIYDEITIEIPEGNYTDKINIDYIKAGKAYGSIEECQKEGRGHCFVIRFSTPEQIVKFINIFLSPDSIDSITQPAEDQIKEITPQLISYQIAVNKPELISDFIVYKIVRPTLSDIAGMIVAHDCQQNDNTIKLLGNIFRDVYQALNSFKGISFNTFKNIYIKMLAEFPVHPILKQPSFFKSLPINSQPDPSCAELYNKILEAMRETKLLWAFDAHKVIVDNTPCLNDVANIIVGYAL